MNLSQLRALLQNSTITYVGREDGFVVIVLNGGDKYAISADDEMNYGGVLVKLN